MTPFSTVSTRSLHPVNASWPTLPSVADNVIERIEAPATARVPIPVNALPPVISVTRAFLKASAAMVLTVGGIYSPKGVSIKAKLQLPMHVTVPSSGMTLYALPDSNALMSFCIRQLFVIKYFSVSYGFSPANVTFFTPLHAPW